MTEAQLQEIKVQLVMAHEYCVLAFAMRGLNEPAANKYEEKMTEHTASVQRILLGGTV